VQHRQRAEEEASQLKDVSEELQRQVENSKMTTDYFSPQLDTLLHIVEELRREMPLKGPDMLC